MKYPSTLFLKSVIVFAGTGALALCLFLLPLGIATDQTGMYRPILIGLYAPAVPFFIALYQGMRLLTFIDRNTAFSPASVSALRKIKYCAIAITALFVAGMPYIFHVADLDDAPGVALIGFIIIFASSVIGVFAAVLQKLLQNAIDIKTENDLTV